MIVICIYHGGVVKPFDCSHFALSSCDGAHSDTCAFLHKEIGPMARSVNKSASLLCFFLGGLLWRGYNIRNLLRRSFRYQAFRLAPATGERKTRFEESELHAWQWLMQWSDRPPLEAGSGTIPRTCPEGRSSQLARFVGWFVRRGGLVRSWWVGSFVVGGGRGACAALWPRPVCCSVCWLVRVGLVRSWWVADGVRVPRFGHVPSAARCVGWFVLGWFVRGGLVRSSRAADGVRVPRFGHVPSAARLVRFVVGSFVRVAGCGRGACAALWPRPVCCSAGSFRGGLVRSSRAAGGVRVPRFGHVPSAARCVGWFVLWLNSVCVRRCNCRLSHLWSKTSLLCSQFLGRRIRQQPCNHWASELVSFSWWFLSVSGFGTAAGATCEARPASCAASSWAAGSDSSRVTS